MSKKNDMPDSRKRPILANFMESEPHKRAMTNSANGAKFHYGLHIPFQAQTRGNSSIPIPERSISSQPVHEVQHDRDELPQEAGEDPNDTYFDDFRPENDFEDQLANYIRPKQLKQPVQASTTLMWRHMKSLPQIEAERPEQLPDVSRGFYTHFSLPRMRNIELNPRFSGKSFNVKWGSNSVALAVYLTGDEAERPCKKCARRSGPFVGCVLPAKSVLQHLSSIACANCRYNWQGKQCEWYVNNKELLRESTPHPQHIKVQGADDGRSLAQPHLQQPVFESQRCTIGGDLQIVHYNQNQDHLSRHVPGQPSPAFTPVPKTLDANRAMEHGVSEPHLTAVVDRFFESIPKLKKAVRKVDRLASTQREESSVQIKQEHETEFETYPDYPQVEVSPVPDSRSGLEDVLRDSDWEVAPGIFRGQRCSEKIAYSAAYLENTSSPIPVHDGVGARLQKIVPSGIGHVFPSNQGVQLCFVHGGTAEVTMGIDRVIVSTGGMFKIMEAHAALVRNLSQVDITIYVVALAA